MERITLVILIWLSVLLAAVAFFVSKKQDKPYWTVWDSIEWTAIGMCLSFSIALAWG